jgi:hypothetical protein
VPAPPTLVFCWLTVARLLALDLSIAAFVIKAMAVEYHS